MLDLEPLRRAPVFAGLPQETLSAIAACFTRRVFGKGVFIYHKEGLGRSLYLIESGSVRLVMFSESGQEFSFDIYGPGDIFGELSVLDGGERETSAMALETTSALTMPGDEFADHMAKSERLARNILDLVIARQRFSIAGVAALAFLDTNGRLAARLLDLADRYGQPCPTGIQIKLKLTQIDLAASVAASRERVNKVLGSFRERGLVAIDADQKIVILDRRGLQRQIRD